MTRFSLWYQQLPLGQTLVQLALWVLLSAVALLTLPLAYLQSLYLQNWVTNNGFYLGLAVITSTAFLVAWLVRISLESTLSQWREAKQKQQLQEKINLLDASERAILREFFLQGKALVIMPLLHPTVEGLLRNGILEQIGSIEHYAIEGPVANLKISSLARSSLTRHILRLPEGTPTETQRATLLAARPEFAVRLSSRSAAA